MYVYVYMLFMSLVSVVLDIMCRVCVFLVIGDSVSACDGWVGMGDRVREKGCGLGCVMGVRTSYDIWAGVAHGESFTGSFMESFKREGVSRSEGMYACSAQCVAFIVGLCMLGVTGVLCVAPGIWGVAGVVRAVLLALLGVSGTVLVWLALRCGVM